MGKKKAIEDLKDAIFSVGYSGAKRELSALLKVYPVDEASEIISTLFVEDYTLHKAGNMAVLLEHALKERPDLAKVVEPQNFLFNMCIFTGSWDIYECYVEEFLEPYTLKMEADDRDDFVIDLLTSAEPLVEVLFDNYEILRKGNHFNGAFGKTGDGLCSMHVEDYQKMDALVENYNKIIGRRDILVDLNKRV